MDIDMTVGLMGVGLTVLGIVLAYMCKTNGKVQVQMITALERIEKGQEHIAQMLLNQTKILGRIEAAIVGGKE